MARRKRNYFPPQQLIPILATLLALFAVIALREPCTRGVENLFRAFEVPDAGPGAAPVVPRPGGGAIGDPVAPPPAVVPPTVPAGAAPDAAPAASAAPL